MTKFKIFKNDILNQKFEDEGYVKLKLFNSADCSKIKNEALDKFYKHSHQKHYFFPIPNPSTTDAECRRLHSFFENIVEEKVYEHLNSDYSLGFSGLFYKKRKSKELIFHVDQTYYNQKSNNPPIHIWAGVEKTTIKNGCLRVVPKSHKLSFDYEAFPFNTLGNTARSANLKDAYNELIDKYAIDIPLKKGEVIIHHQSLIHGSRPNNSYFKKRIAFKITLNPKDIDYFEIAYFHEERNTVEIFGAIKDVITNNLTAFDNYEYIKKLVKSGKISLIKELKLEVSNLPFKSLKEMEEIMETPGNYLKAKFELCK
ncbi:MAG: hypothetical protein COA67_00645 [Lutibacter sp.]|nr:MAG: hypothetical protein COA67_00645 [Lutibacter sp.]